MGAVLNSPLPPVPPPSPCAVRPLRSADVTPLQRYCGPSRYRLAFGRLPGGCRLYGRSCSTDFSVGRGRFLQLLSMSLSPCYPYPPRRSVTSHQSVCAAPCYLRSEPGGSASGPNFFEAITGFTDVMA